MIALIMAGGSGTRFWPVSTAGKPKQFLPLAGGRSLLAETVARIDGLTPPERTLIVTGEAFVQRTRREPPSIPPENVIGEPLGRNTAPCVAVGTAVATARWGGDEVMLVLPADHFIGDRRRFHEIVRAGEAYCREEADLVTLGIRPVAPETGYGYVEIGEERRRAGDVAVHAVRRFVEKPDRATAERYVAGGRHLWNSGIFLWRLCVIREAIEKHVPGAAALLTAIEGVGTGGLSAVLAEAYPRLPALSIDYAVMEKAENIATVPADFPWSDVGSWNALGDLLEEDEEGNCVAGAHVGVDTTGCIISSPSRLVATIGLRNLVLVATQRAVLVCPRGRAQEVRAVVERLREEGREEYL